MTRRITSRALAALGLRWGGFVAAWAQGTLPAAPPDVERLRQEVAPGVWRIVLDMGNDACDCPKP
jgi:hypothetical protein